MQKISVLAALVSILPVFAQAKDRDPEPAIPGEALSVRPASRAAEEHIRNFLEGKLGEMERTYAERIVLVPGSEMLKDKYGLAGAKGDMEPVVVGRATLLVTMKEAFGGRPLLPPEVIDAYFDALKFEPLDAGVGDYATDPPDPVGTPDGKIHFTIEPGDVLFKVGPEKGDFMLFQFRAIDGVWVVVAEYLD